MKRVGHLKLVVNNTAPVEPVDISIYLAMIDTLKSNLSTLTIDQLLVKMLIFREAALVDKVLPIAKIVEGLALLKEIEEKSTTEDMKSMARNSYTTFEQELKNLVKK